MKDLARTSASEELAAGLRRALTTLALALFAPSAAFADIPVAESLIATYSALESYCDTVTVAGPWNVSSELQRCYARDGRYKSIEQFSAPASQRHLDWGDNVRSYTWITSGHVSNMLTTTYYADGLEARYRSGGVGLPIRILHPFLNTTGNESDIRYALRDMKVVEDGPTATIWQRRLKNPAGIDVVTRVVVRRSDGLVTHSEEIANGQIQWSATLVAARINASLSPADLSETAPLLQRYSLMRRPREFVAGLAVAVFVIGLVLSIAWRRPRNWGAIWRAYAKGVGITIMILTALSALTLLPGARGGHPPLIFFLMILAMYAALAALALVALMLGMQLGDRGRRIR